MLRTARAVVFCFAIVLAILFAMSAQESSSTASPSDFGGPQDWSNRHGVYTRDGSGAQMLLRHYDPRFVHSLYRPYSQDQRKDLAAALGFEPPEADQNQREEADW